MPAFTLDSFGTQTALRDDLPKPRVGDNELLVRVHASSVKRKPRKLDFAQAGPAPLAAITARRSCLPGW
jgi:hypothetical protein